MAEPIIVTEQWTGSSFSRRPPWTAVRMFLVTGFDDGDDACGAIGDNGIDVPGLNDTYPGRPFLQCDGVEVAERLGPLAFLVKVGYSVSTRGAHFDQYDDLLMQPMRIQWSTASVTETVDRDVLGNPLVNSSLDPIPNATRTFSYKQLRIWRYELGYDFNTAIAFENTVNLDAVHSGAVTFPAGCLMCSSICPMEEYDAEAAILRIAYTFQCRLNGDSASYGIAPFQWRFLDQGRRGWYTASGTNKVGELVGPLGQAHTEVRMNGYGAPFDAGMWTVEGNTPESFASPPAGATLESTTKAVFLRYKRYRETAFGTLGLF